MALAIRVDSLSRDASGRITLMYTRGQSPLPAAKGPEGFMWGSKEDLVAELDDAADRLNARDLLLMMLAIWRRAQPGMTNPSAIIGKTITFDLQPAGISITVS